MDATGELLRNFLAGRDVACPHCEYNLRDLKGEVCPECGEKINLRIGLGEPRQGLLIAGLIGLSAGAGFNALVLIYYLVQQIRTPQVPWDKPITCLVTNIGGLLVVGTAMALWLYRWRSIRRRAFQSRLWLMIGCWVLTMLNILVFSLLIP